MESSANHFKVFLKILAFALMCVGFFIFHIWFRTKVVTKGFEVTEQRKNYAQLESKLMKLRVEQNKVMGHKSLERYAQKFEDTEEALSPAQPSQLIYIKSEKGEPLQK